MSTPAFRRFANPLSIWIAMLAIVLQSVMPMVAQARMRAPGASVAAAATHGMSTACDEPMPMGHAMPADAGVAATHHAMPAQDASATAHTGAPQGEQVSDHAAAADASLPANPHAMHGDAPCPYCRVHLDAVSLPPVPNPHWVLLVTVVHRAIADEAVPVLPEAWSPTRPRGPPLIA